MLNTSYLAAVEAVIKPHHHVLLLFVIFMALCLLITVLGFLLHERTLVSDEQY